MSKFVDSCSIFLLSLKQVVHCISFITYVLFIQFLFCCIGICADIAVSKHEHWSSLAPLPFEIVISAGQKAKEEWRQG